MSYRPYVPGNAISNLVGGVAQGATPVQTRLNINQGMQNINPSAWNMPAGPLYTTNSAMPGMPQPAAPYKVPGVMMSGGRRNTTPNFTPTPQAPAGGNPNLRTPIPNLGAGQTAGPTGVQQLAQQGQAGLQNMLNPPPPNTMLGGPQYPSAYMSPSGPMENQLFNMYNGGQQGFTAQLNPFVNSLAGGQLPPAIQQQLMQNLDYNRQAMMNQYGRSGGLFGSDAAGYIARQQGRTITDAMAQAQQMGLQANQMNAANYYQGLGQYLGVGRTLLGSELTRNMTAQQMLWSEYLQQQGVPPEVAALIAAGSIGPGVGSSSGIGGIQDTTGSAIAGGLGGAGQVLGGILGGGSTAGAGSGLTNFGGGAGTNFGGGYGFL